MSKNEKKSWIVTRYDSPDDKITKSFRSLAAAEKWIADNPIDGFSAFCGAYYTKPVCVKPDHHG